MSCGLVLLALCYCTLRSCNVFASEASGTLSQHGISVIRTVDKNENNVTTKTITRIVAEPVPEKYDSRTSANASHSDEKKHRRSKRYLDFTEGTRISFRAAFKNNILKVNTLWGYGVGYRVNFPFPTKNDRLRPFFKRDVLDSTVLLLNEHGLDGSACLLKTFCTAVNDIERTMGKGIFFKLLKEIFSERKPGARSKTFFSGVMNAFKVFVVTLMLQNVRCLEKSGSSEFSVELMDPRHRIEGFTTNGNSSMPVAPLKRAKRYLDFLPKTIIFYRVNAKNSITYPIIWAYAYGVRSNIFIENMEKARPFRRDTYNAWQELLDHVGLDGKACLLKAFCTAKLLEEDVERDFGKLGILFKLLRHIFTLNTEDRSYFSYLREENCRQILHSHCPLSFNNISPFTDEI